MVLSNCIKQTISYESNVTKVQGVWMRVLIFLPWSVVSAKISTLSIAKIDWAKIFIKNYQYFGLIFYVQEKLDLKSSKLSNFINKISGLYTNLLQLKLFIIFGNGRLV